MICFNLNRTELVNFYRDDTEKMANVLSYFFLAMQQGQSGHFFTPKLWWRYNFS